MPNYDSTEIQKAITKAESSFAGAENREGSNNTAKLLFSNEGSAFLNMEQKKKESLVQPTEIILQKKQSLTITENKLSDHSGGIGDSFATPITYVGKTANFNVSYKLAENNLFGYQEQMNQGFINATSTIRESINSYALAQLSALKTQVAATGTLMVWDGTNHKYTNTAANKEKFATNIKKVATKNKYGGALDIIGGQQLTSDLIHNAAQGSSNQVNFGYQYGNLSIAEDENLDEATLGVNGYGFVMPKGMVGMSSWNEPINRRGEGDAASKTGLYSTFVDPFIPGLVYDIHINRGLADTTIGSTTYYQDIVDKVEVTAIYTLSHAMISVTNETPIFAAEQL